MLWGMLDFLERLSRWLSCLLAFQLASGFQLSCTVTRAGVSLGDAAGSNPTTLVH